MQSLKGRGRERTSRLTCQVAVKQPAASMNRKPPCKGGSKRWLNDGISSLKVFTAGEALESQARCWGEPSF